MRLRVVIFLIGVALASWLVTPTQAQEVCAPVGQSAKEAVSGVHLTWDSAFQCADVPPEGEYQITVTVVNQSESAEAVVIEAVRLSHTTPRPRKQSPDATAEAEGLPVVVAPGDQAAFTVRGAYTLVKTDEGGKANLHLRALGHSQESVEPFVLGINVHLRGPEASEEVETAFVHPVISSIAAALGLPYDQLAVWHEQGIGLGNIVRAVFLARTVGVDPETVLQQLTSGQGWGTIMQEYGVHPGAFRNGQNLGAIRSGRVVTDTVSPSWRPLSKPVKSKEKGSAKNPPGLNKVTPGQEGKKASGHQQAPGRNKP